MSISLIVTVGLPVLYVTGSLRKATSAAGIGGAAFVLYFVTAGLLGLVPPVSLMASVSVSASGFFLFAAACIYLVKKKGYTFRFFLAATITVLMSVSASFVSISYTISYLPAALGLAVSLLAVACLGRRAPLGVPVLIGIYSIAEDIMMLLTEAVSTAAFFDLVDITLISFVVCLAAAYLLAHPLRRVRAAVLAQHNM